MRFWRYQGFSLCAGMTLVLLLSGSALAAPADAREVARLNNCPPKKVEVYRQSLGAQGRTIYRVECNLPKAKDESAPKGADALLIQCDGSLCQFLRAAESK